MDNSNIEVLTNAKKGFLDSLLDTRARANRAAKRSDYIDVRIEQLTIERDNPNNSEEDSNWYNRIIQELEWVKSQQMASRNDITGDAIQSKTLSKQGRDNWDNIFGKKKKTEESVKKDKVINKTKQFRKDCGAVAQLGERFPCTEEVVGSIPISSTTFQPVSSLSAGLGTKEMNEAQLYRA